MASITTRISNNMVSMPMVRLTIKFLLALKHEARRVVMRPNEFSIQYGNIYPAPML